MIDVRADKQWLTAAEAAAEQLPGLPDKRTVQRALTAGSLRWRKREGRGGGREFHWTDLPHEARREYLQRYGVATLAKAEQPAAREASLESLCDARRAIVDAAWAFIAQGRVTAGQGLSDFCAAYQKRLVRIEPWVFNFVPTLNVHALRCWKRRLANEVAPIRKRGRKDGTGMIEQNVELRNFITARALANSHFTARHILRDIQSAGLPNVALRTLQLFLANFRKQHKFITEAVTHPDAARSHYLPAFGSRSAGIVRLNQRWEMDGTTADAMCRMPNGSEWRVKITALIDVATRRAMVLVSDQGRAAATMALLRRAIIAWGIPEQIKTDNGKEFTAQAVVNFCRDLGIEVIYSTPFQPQQKPHIERFFGTLNRDLFPRLPAFVGHSVADRKAIESRRSFQHRHGQDAQLVKAIALTPGELQARCDRWLSEEYEQHAHDGLKIGATPFEAALVLADQAVAIKDERLLDQLLLIEPGVRHVVKKGIRLANRWYIAGQLGAHMGDRVSIRIDAHDPSVIFVYSADRTTFLCIAECPDFMTPQRQMQIAGAAKSAHATRVNRTRADVRKVHRLYPVSLDEQLGAGDTGIALTADAEEAQRLASPPRLVAHSDALDAAQVHARGPQPVDATPDQVATAEAMVAQIDARTARNTGTVECDGYTRPQFETDLGFWKWAERFVAGGGALDEQDAREIASLRASKTFQLQIAAAAANA